MVLLLWPVVRPVGDAGVVACTVYTSREQAVCSRRNHGLALNKNGLALRRRRGATRQGYSHSRFDRLGTNGLVGARAGRVHIHRS